MISRLVLSLALAFTLSAQVPANLSPFSIFLASGSTIEQVATDGNGYIWIYGETNIPENGYPHDVFVSRLDPAAASLLRTVDPGGESAITRTGALAVDRLREALKLSSAAIRRAEGMGCVQAAERARGQQQRINDRRPPDL
jgi:hypothetical protein